jgi:nucleotide-binding universal stress UspA family protein
MKLPEILVAVDGSDYSKKIVEYACDLAKKLSYQIVLIYVSKFPDLVEQYQRIGGVEPSAQGKRYVEAAEKVTSQLAGIVSKQGIPVETVLESGNPADKIITTAAFRKSSLIAIGLRGLHGIERVRSLGSVSRRVLEGAPCPVVVVTESPKGKGK